ncbi:Crp/Fnr family transcriptional regulator [Bacillus sp. 03113]|uniref:Crp/Fnr family transcriptional regulator n=1 Tax=Bacillus sp. 03113 TaxID=2578211 RepID=UPI001144D723|nr:Crp/Fnr family transcriptional regulator [Bacillus sp. 03113]
MPADQKENLLYELFRKYGTLQEFKKNSFVYSKGEPSKAAYFIENGLLKVCQLTQKGQNVTFFIRKTGDYFGMAEIILKQNHPCYAQCLNNSQIWVLPSSIVEEKLESDPKVNREILYTLTNRLIQQQTTVEQLVSKPASARLAWLLEQLGKPGPAGEWLVNMMLTHEEMSNIVGCSRQTISELFNKWRSQGIMNYTRNKLTIYRLDDLMENL